MEPNKDHIKDIFSSKLSDFNPEVPLAVWDNIEKQLNNATTKPIFDKRVSVKKQIINIGSWIVGIAAVVLMLVYMYPQSTDSFDKGQTFASEFFAKNIQLKQIDKEMDGSLSPIEKESGKNQNQNPLLSQSLSKSVNRALINLSQKVLNTQNITTSYVRGDTIKNDLFVEHENVNHVLYNDEDSVVIATQLALEKDDKLKREMALKMFNAEREHLDELLADNSSSGGIMSSQGDRGLLLGFQGGSGFFKSDDTKNQLNTYSGSNSNVVVARESKLRMKHNQPITFGVTVSKKINDKLSLESGVVYIYLSSRFKTDEIANIRHNDMQHLHYLGIPLTLNYNFADWNKFKLYSSVGGLIQKDFYGRKSGNTYMDGILQSDFYYKQKISQRNPQFSINAGLGLSYPLYNQLRVYSTFGGAYYLKSKNEYETIYSDKKWLFNLNIGLRFEF